MRLLVDECLPNVLVDALIRRGHDVNYAAAAAPGDVDGDVLERSVSQRRLVVTADRGFGPMAIRERRAAIGIVVAVFGQSKAGTPASAEDIAGRIDELGESGLVGRLTILEPDRTRQRNLPRVAAAR